MAVGIKDGFGIAGDTEAVFPNMPLGFFGRRRVSPALAIEDGIL
jgi:hypothetical protein